ncbi:hypothetical protein DY000_02016190 [Brassica cretica]|uniref:Uncharacterized protein n=1 Tax=Brassica cretica TaxID=69181 RepID=A0ABQ7D1K3_BRACR|nr:hypothetical protein DY000_02016190 [Brassica cretica]
MIKPWRPNSLHYLPVYEPLTMDYNHYNQCAENGVSAKESAALLLIGGDFRVMRVLLQISKRRPLLGRKLTGSAFAVVAPSAGSPFIGGVRVIMFSPLAGVE